MKTEKIHEKYGLRKLVVLSGAAAAMAILGNQKTAKADILQIYPDGTSDMQVTAIDSYRASSAFERIGLSYENAETILKVTFDDGGTHEIDIANDDGLACYEIYLYDDGDFVKLESTYNSEDDFTTVTVSDGSYIALVYANSAAYDGSGVSLAAESVAAAEETAAEEVAEETAAEEETVEEAAVEEIIVEEATEETTEETALAEETVTVEPISTTYIYNGSVIIGSAILFALMITCGIVVVKQCKISLEKRFQEGREAGAEKRRKKREEKERLKKEEEERQTRIKEEEEKEKQRKILEEKQRKDAIREAERLEKEKNPKTPKEYDDAFSARLNTIQKNKAVYDDCLITDLAALHLSLKKMQEFADDYPEIVNEKTYKRFMDYYLPEALKSVDSVIEINSLKDGTGAVSTRTEVKAFISDVAAGLNEYLSDDLLLGRLSDTKASAQAARTMLRQDGFLGAHFKEKVPIPAKKDESGKLKKA